MQKARHFFLGSVGRNVKSLAWRLFRIAIAVVTPGERELLALDDTPPMPARGVFRHQGSAATPRKIHRLWQRLAKLVA